MNHRMIVFAAMVAMLGATAACAPPDGSESSTGTPTSPMTTSPAPTVVTGPLVLPPVSPPAITRPLTATVDDDSVCELLTDEQAAAHGFAGTATPQEEENPNEHACVHGKYGDAFVRVSVWNMDLLGSIYRGEYHRWNSDQGFRPLTIAGQPAAIFEKPPYFNGCRLAVGIAAGQGVEVKTYSDDHEDARITCARTVAITEDVLHNLGG